MKLTDNYPALNSYKVMHGANRALDGSAYRLYTATNNAKKALKKLIPADLEQQLIQEKWLYQLEYSAAYIRRKLINAIVLNDILLIAEKLGETVYKKSKIKS